MTVESKLTTHSAESMVASHLTLVSYYYEFWFFRDIDNKHWIYKGKMWL